MRYLIVLILILILLPASLSDVFAWHWKRPVTPYGDFCPYCSSYGTCSSPMSHEDAKKAIRDYYHKKGFNVELEKKRGMFIRAKVKYEDEVVDVIIFDRRTGRVRSIY